MNLQARRELLKFFAASPLLAGIAPLRTSIANDKALASATDALDVFDLEAAAKRVVPPAHWGYIQSGVDGMLYSPGNAAEMRAALEQLTADPALTEKLGRTALRKVMESHTLDRYARKILELVEELHAR